MRLRGLCCVPGSPHTPVKRPARRPARISDGISQGAIANITQRTDARRVLYLVRVPRRQLVSKGDSDRTGCPYHFSEGIDHFDLANGVCDVDALDSCVSQADHFPEATVSDQLYRCDAEAGT